MGCVVESESEIGASIDILVGLLIVSFSLSLSSLGDIAVVGSGDLAEKENGARILESRFAGEYIEDLDVSFSFSFSSSAVVGSVGIMISLALGIFPDVDADEAV